MGENKNEMSIASIEKMQCMGCGLCVEVCPVQCISMKEDNEGFLFPIIDERKCTNCGACLRKCPATTVSENLFKQKTRKYFCAIIKDEDILLKSSSGGMFGILAKYIIDEGGYVCGCVYNDRLEAIHIISNQQSDIERMYGSKYVQSRVEQCYKEIRDKLLEGSKLLFTGTACQIAALRLYLGKEYAALYCVEILCHGVPAPGLFRCYKEYLEHRLHGVVKDIRFRDKREKGWGSEHRMCVIYEKNGQIFEHRPVLPAYFSAFFYGLNLRESCYQCKFARLDRVADLTIGDYWGSWAKYGKRFREGISVVGVNTLKGYALAKMIYGQFKHYEELTESEAITSNDNFSHSVKRPGERTNYYERIVYKKLWIRTYFTKTYRLKTVKSVYGALLPETMRIKLHKVFRRQS